MTDSKRPALKVVEGLRRAHNALHGASSDCEVYECSYKSALATVPALERLVEEVAKHREAHENMRYCSLCVFLCDFDRVNS